MTATRDLLLHIGHFKTGTTALQVFLSSNAPALAAQGLHYATTARRLAKHSDLAFSVLRAAGAQEMLFGYKDRVTAEACWSALLSEARALPEGHALVVSSEEFIRFGAHFRSTDILRGLLADTGDLRIRAVAYFRPPQAHLASYYNQLVKLDVKLPGFDATVRGVLEAVHWDYALALAPWIELLGPENVLLRQFSDSLRDGDALYRDFFDAIGHPMPEGATFPDGDTNPRLDTGLVTINRMLRRLSLKPRLARALRGSLQEGLLAERGSENGPDFDTIRARAKAGIETALRLPQARLNREALLGDLPRPQDQGDRLRDEATAMLLTEIAELRNLIARQGARIEALEAARATPEPGPAQVPAKRRKDPES